MLRRLLWVLLGVAVVLVGTAMLPAQANSLSTLPPSRRVNHVFIVMEENHSYEEVIGNPQMPYLNSLAQSYSTAKAYYANTHPSIGNYFMLTTGQIITNDDGYMGTVSVDNVVRELIAAGKSWKEYSESLPFQGYDGGDSGDYAERHNPCSYFSDVRNDPTQQQNLVPFPQLATDIANHTLPNYGFIVPNLQHDAHNGTLAAADAWLQANIAPLLASPDFTTSGGGLLIITFDESRQHRQPVRRRTCGMDRRRPQCKPGLSAQRVVRSADAVSASQHAALHVAACGGQRVSRSGV